MPLGVGDLNISLKRELSSWAETAINIKRIIGATNVLMTDVTAAIEFAISRIQALGADEQGMIFFPPGVWLISSEIVVDAPVVFQGMGPSSVIRLIASTDLAGGAMFDIDNQADVRFRNLTIDGNNTNATLNGTGIRISGTSSAVFVENCKIIQHSDDGIDIEGGSVIQVVTSDIGDNTDRGINIDTPGAGESLTDVLIEDNFINGNDIGLRVRDGGSVAFDRIGIQGNDFFLNTTSNYDDNTNVPQETMLPNNIPAIGGAVGDRAKIEQTVAQTINTGITAQLTFDATVFDSNSIADLANNRLTVQTAGDYVVVAHMRLPALAAEGLVLDIRINGTVSTLASDSGAAGNVGGIGAHCLATDAFTLAVNDNITAFLFNNTVANQILSVLLGNRAKLWLTQIG